MLRLKCVEFYCVAAEGEGEQLSAENPRGCEAGALAVVCIYVNGIHRCSIDVATPDPFANGSWMEAHDFTSDTYKKEQTEHSSGGTLVCMHA